MSVFAKELRRLSGLNRNKKNFETINGQVEELAELMQDASDYLSQLDSAREAMSSFMAALSRLRRG